ncbi:MAG: hypothetical protein OEV85_06845 [Candidatus Thorarchaeota archaeon]|nr:hypothetical protein [Candidatus Thorarchaeota archaeon]
MKQRIFALLLLTVVAISTISISVEAQTNTLEWGVSVDDEFTYVLQRAYFVDPAYMVVVEEDLPYITYLPVGEKATMRAAEFDAIPSLINESSQMPLAYCDLVRANDSVSIATNQTGFIVPIGDWNFLTEIANITGLHGVTLIDTADEWGTVGTGTFQAGDGSIISIYIEVRYEKENGTLNYLRHKYATLGTDLIDVVLVNWHDGMPTVIGAEIQLSTILIIVIGGVVGIIIAFIVIQWYRSKKPIVRKLGE